MKNEISKKANAIKIHFKECNYAQLEQLLSNIYGVFISKNNLDNRFKFDVNEEIVLVILFMLHRKGLFYIAEELRELYFPKDKSEHNLYEELKNLEKTKKKIIKKLKEKNYKEAKKINEEYLEKYKEDHTFIELELKLICEIYRETSDSVVALIKYASSIFPQDGDYSKYYGDYLWNIGRKNEAIFEYKKALGLSSNGFIQLDIKKIFKENKIT